MALEVRRVVEVSLKVGPDIRFKFWRRILFEPLSEAGHFPGFERLPVRRVIEIAVLPDRNPPLPILVARIGGDAVQRSALKILHILVLRESDGLEGHLVLIVGD